MFLKCELMDQIIIWNVFYFFVKNKYNAFMLIYMPVNILSEKKQTNIITAFLWI